MGAVTAQEYRAAVGEDASPSATVKSDVGLSYADVQRLLQFIFAKVRRGVRMSLLRARYLPRGASGAS